MRYLLLACFVCCSINLWAQIQKISSVVNTQYDEINPVVSPDGKTLYFTRVGDPTFDKSLVDNGKDLADALTFRQYKRKLKSIFSLLGSTADTPQGSVFNQDVWIARYDDGDFNKLEHPGYPLNNALPNSVCAITKDPQTVVLLNHWSESGSMRKGFSMSTRDGDEWSFPKPLHIYDYENLESSVNLTLSKDNEVMILSIAQPGGIGKHDLYVSFRIHNTLWSSPKHMGSVINSAQREITPFITDDKKYLFFASDRPGSIGGMDLYVSERLDNSWIQWSSPERLPEPINTKFDDAQPFLNRVTNFLYFSSTRAGNSDIYRMPFNKRPPAQLLAKKKTKTEPVNREVRFMVVNSNTRKPVNAKIHYSDRVDGPLTNTIASTSKGFLMEFSTSQTRRLQAEKDEYLTREIKINPQSLLATEQPMVQIAIDPIAPGTQISLNPIYFMRSKDRILSASYPELEYLSKVLKKHRGVHIEINGHTDNVGDQKALFDLSQKRSVAIKRYLVRRGIQAHRIKTKGLGGSRPLTDNSNESMRARNRRVEVIITRTD